jgi:hypothetical protein
MYDKGLSFFSWKALFNPALIIVAVRNSWYKEEDQMAFRAHICDFDFDENKFGFGAKSLSL